MTSAPFPVSMEPGPMGLLELPVARFHFVLRRGLGPLPGRPGRFAAKRQARKGHAARDDGNSEGLEFLGF